MEGLWYSSKSSVGLTMNHLLCLFTLLFCSVVSGEESVYPPQVDFLDSPVSIFNNPLQGIKAFTVITPGKSDEINFFVEELKKIGTVKTLDAGIAPVNFEGMGTGMRLMLSISRLQILGKTDSDITRISLLLETSVEVLKTKQNLSNTYVWESNVFADKEHTMDGVKKLTKQFLYYYQEANPNGKPHFYVYL